MRVGIFHWKARSWGGAEYLISKIAEVLGVRKIYTLGHPSTPNPYADVEFYDLRVSYYSKFLLNFSFFRFFEYSIWESIDITEIGDFDVIITSGATAKAIIPPDNVMHINYCYSPPRWLYDLYHFRIKKVKLKPIYNYMLRKARIQDSLADRRVDYYYAVSPIVKRRIWKYYKRDSIVLYPPLDLSQYRAKEGGSFYLYLGRIDYEKGVVEIVKAFKKIGLPLKLVGGKGTAFEEVMEIIKNCSNIEYVGFVSQDEKIKLLGECKAVIFNAINEDFGIVPIEANASGKPCLTVKSGFPGIFIEDGINGLFHDGSVEGIIKAVKKCEKSDFNPKEIRERVKIFSFDNFKKKLISTLNEFYEEFNKLEV